MRNMLYINLHICGISKQLRMAFDDPLIKKKRTISRNIYIYIILYNRNMYIPFKCSRSFLTIENTFFC